MIVDSTGSRGAVVGAIRNAASATGADFQYLLATAQVESGFNPTATVSTSSAKGLFQFIDQTWLATLKQAGPQLGYGRYADAITQTPSGTYAVADPAMRREILALRDDPVANAAMAGAFTQQNAALLKDRIGRDATEGELYIAHFMGAGGGAQLINLAQQNPGAPAATAFPGAAKSNPSIFYDRQGHARSAAEVYHVLVARYDVARAAPTISAGATTTAAATLPAAARTMTMAQLASQATANATPPVVTVNLPAIAPTGPVFHSLFSDTQRQPVPQLVQDLWTSNPRVAAALTGQADSAATATTASQPPARNGRMDLFSDRPADVRALFGERT
ncbi:MAG TPA: transglycosylase SLT domain-containing protein [Xanthobacteraceae bacterium]|nr:transglycosylase SLT domain-containing protein [Xanthobacteraceae bacterium]